MFMSENSNLKIDLNGNLVDILALTNINPKTGNERPQVTVVSEERTLREMKPQPRTAHMVESVAGFILRSQGGKRTTEQFKQIQKKEAQTLLEKEKEKQAQRENTARLKALRLAKKAT